jgi:SAM-dependent methyltransferase/uncharacterized protein YbaR (Trm112 family)
VLLNHFARLRPVCPVCRPSGQDHALAINLIEAEAAEDITAGILGCPHCGAEFPIVDGLPIIVPDVRRYIQDNAFYLLARDDLPPGLESLIGDASGPNTAVDSVRQHLSSYAWDHWADHDPQEDRSAGPTPGAVARTVDAALAMLPASLAEGPILDIGCGGGRSMQALSERTGRTVLGVDVSVSLARLSRRAAVERRVSYPRRRVGLAYDRRSFALPPAPHPGKMDVWICDALTLPFANGTFALASGFNVIDCLNDPRAGLVEIDRTLKPGGAALLSTPFDWSGNVTPPASWLGGHSQRGPHGGSAEAVLDLLLSDGALGVGTLRKIGAAGRVPWHVRLHDRAFMQYQAYLVAARKAPGVVPPLP